MTSASRRAFIAVAAFAAAFTNTSGISARGARAQIS
jgi:hypothetical protein